MVKPISSAGVLGVCAALALGEAAGFVAAIKTDTKGVQYVEIQQPKIINEKINEFMYAHELRFFTVDIDGNELLALEYQLHA